MKSLKHLGLGRAAIGAVIVTALIGGFAFGLMLGKPAPAQAGPSGFPTFGGVEVDGDGEMDVDRAPDLVAVVGSGDEIAGYAWKTDVFPEAVVTDGPYQEPSIPLYDQRGEELVGYLVPDHGVVTVDAYLSGDFGPTIPTVTVPGD